MELGKLLKCKIEFQFYKIELIIKVKLLKRGHAQAIISKIRILN